MPPDQFTFSNCVQPPGALLLDRGSRLYLDAISSVGGETVTVSVVILLPNGKIQSFPAGTKTVDSNGLIADFVTAALEPYAGFLLSCSLSCSSATFRGETYARISVKKQDGGFSYVLKAGYITKTKPLSYPPIEVEDSLSGYGVLTTPPANSVSQDNAVTWLYTVPTHRVWIFRTLNLFVSTNATVADRVVYAYFNDGISNQAFIYPPRVQPASSNWFYNLSVGINDSVGGLTRISYAMPKIRARAGFSLTASMLNSQAGDSLNFSSDPIIEELLVL